MVDENNNEQKKIRTFKKIQSISVFRAEISGGEGISLVCCCDDTTIRMVRKPVKKQKEHPAGCAGEGKQSRGNIGEKDG